jgi:D-glycero-D-manno-heptose 1,7-bisphosphate phosphatase
MSNVAVFLDRDGTINEQVGYINHLDLFRLLPAAIPAIRLLNQAGLKVVVVTNQSGAARGYFPVAFVDDVHTHMVWLLAGGGARLDGIYTCLHSPVDGCPCRKPNPGLIEVAARDLDLDPSHSYLVGDSYKDIETASNAGVKSILVLTGYGRGEYEDIFPNRTLAPVYVAEDLLDAAKWIIEDLENR